MSFEREDIRADIERVMKEAGFESVWHYRFKAFEPHDLPAVNILPMSDENDDSGFQTVFRRNETFRVEVLLARRQDDEDFAATCDRAYENARVAILKMRPCKTKCAKVTIIRKNWAVDSDGQVPILVIKLTVNVEFDDETDF